VISENAESRSEKSQVVAALPVGALRPVLYYVVLRHPRQYDYAVPLSTSGGREISEVVGGSTCQAIEKNEE
jgi:hypothetical protein